MNDTLPEIEIIFKKMIMSKSHEERLMMGCSMFDSAKKIVKSSITAKHPDLSNREMKKKVFLRFYGSEFNAFQKEKILSYLEDAD